MSEGLLTTPVEGSAAPEPVSSGNTTNGTAPAPSWRDSIAEDLRSDPALLKFSNLDDLAKSYKHLEKSIGANKISIPTDLATDDDWKQVFQKLGLPEKAEEYKVSAPKDAGLDEKFLKSFTENAHKAGVLPKQAEKLLGWYGDMVKGIQEEQKTNQALEAEQTTNSLKREWGAAFNEKIIRAQSAVREFGGEELMGFLNETGLGNNPVMIKLFDKLGGLVKEDSVAGREKTMGVMTPAEAMEKSKQIMGDREHPFNIPHHPNHDKALAEMQRIYELAYPNQDG